ncbi:NUDIX domain-containing protein [Candidatus Dojkabacteria bacterium]|nr:NUDIX domain-containing protein [Candidatus Dojkabacteria bacterium]
MEQLKEIKDASLPEDTTDLKTREAARAILFDENNLIPLLFVAKYNYHKLPGGGIDEGENKSHALVRECLEEVGCEIEINGEVGKVVEFRSKWNLKQISYCYYGKIISMGEPDFTEKELCQGFEIVWLSLEDAISKVEKDKPRNYPGSFIQKRDIEFLKKAEQIVRAN